VGPRYRRVPPLLVGPAERFNPERGALYETLNNGFLIGLRLLAPAFRAGRHPPQTKKSPPGRLLPFPGRPGGEHCRLSGSACRYSDALPTWVSRPKGGLGQNCETGDPSPVPLPVPADNYPCSSANAPCSDLKGIVAPARPLIHARDAWRQDFDMIAAGDPPLSGPDSRACRGAQPALPPAYPITTAGAPTRTRP
jgi:hypothetical protein